MGGNVEQAWYSETQNIGHGTDGTSYFSRVNLCKRRNKIRYQCPKSPCKRKEGAGASWQGIL